MSRLNIYSKEQIDANVGSSDDTASASGTLWARLKNAVARIVGLESADAQNVKLTGAQTIAGQKTLSNSPIVPTTPTTATGAVNSVYVNDATDGVNNIVHKSGNETIGGLKKYTDDCVYSKGYPTISINDTSLGYNEIGNHSAITMYDKNSYRITMLRSESSTLGANIASVTRLTAHVRQSSNPSNEVSANVTIVASEDGTQYMTAPYRTSGQNNNDVVTIGTLRALGLIQ